MEIKIDTKHDSPEDIRKAIEFLKRIVEGEADNKASRDFQTTPELGAGMNAMFGDTPILSSIPDDAKGKDEDSDEEEETERIEIIPY